MGTSRLPIFQEHFKSLRGEMTQGQFAEKLGISRPTVGLYESGARIPDAEVLRDIAVKCGASADYLIGLSKVPSSNADVKAAAKYTGLSEAALFEVRKAMYDFHCHELSAFLENYGASISGQLQELKGVVGITKSEIEKMEQTNDFSVSAEVLEMLELTAFRFSEFCREIANSFGLYDLMHKVEKLNREYATQQLKKLVEQLEAEDGEHQED